MNEKNKDVDVSIILSQWQTCVEMANSISNRRDTMNNIFITVNVGIVATISFVWDIKYILLSILGIIINAIWRLFIRNFKLLNQEKFNVILEMEEKLPLQPFNAEWEKLKNNKNYKDGTKIEKYLPYVFAIIYIISLIVLAFK